LRWPQSGDGSGAAPLLRWLHVVGAAVLLGTGAGIAFFMLVAHRTGDARLVAHVARTVVLADALFTAMAVVLQPAWRLGWSLGEGWIVLSLGLYVVTGMFWLPVVAIQIQAPQPSAAGCGGRGGIAGILPPPVPHLVRLRFPSLRVGARNHLADAGAAFDPAVVRRALAPAGPAAR
jgi:uncharacterized membrane protein